MTDLHLLPTLVTADQFTVAELVAVYNQTRVDYLVPMPMNTARLQDYITTYDVDLRHSFVALLGDEVLGLAMLGVRPPWGWVTRLGVLPTARRHGAGRQLMAALMGASDALGLPHMLLEVIKHNTPAHDLFVRCGFVATRELLVLRRPPGPAPQVPGAVLTPLDRAAVLARLPSPAEPAAWTNQLASFSNATGIEGLAVTLADGSAGWLAWQRQRFVLTRLNFATTSGDPAAVAAALLGGLYGRYADVDTHTENLAVTNPHLPALWAAGFIESFRRIEMVRPAAAVAGR